MWPDHRLLELFDTEHPIVQAPMAGSGGTALTVSVSEAGGLGSFPGASFNADKLQSKIGIIQQRTAKPFNVNFFCHTPAVPDPAREAAWKKTLSGYYAQFGIEPNSAVTGMAREPFDDHACAVIEKLKPKVVSFHYGLPAEPLLNRVKGAGCCIISSATTVAEARWLEERGCDAIIAQGVEAGGHRGMFLTEDVASQVGTFALVPQVADAVAVPVIAAGGIGDGRGIAAALALGASGVQMGTAYLFTPQSLIGDSYRKALRGAQDDITSITNLFSGRPARGIVNRLMREIGPMSDAAPAFPLASAALAPLQARDKEAGSMDFTQVWAGQAGAFGRALDAGELTQQLASDALVRLSSIAPNR